MRIRIKTLAEIGEQYDRICEYLDEQGRTESSRKVTELYECAIGRILQMLGVTKLDDDSLEFVLVEPLMVGSY